MAGPAFFFQFCSTTSGSRTVTTSSIFFLPPPHLPYLLFSLTSINSSSAGLVSIAPTAGHLCMLCDPCSTLSLSIPSYQLGTLHPRIMIQVPVLYTVRVHFLLEFFTSPLTTYRTPDGALVVAIKIYTNNFKFFLTPKFFSSQISTFFR